MKLHDKLISTTGDVVSITHAPKPPQKWQIQYENGTVKHKTKSFLKKYFKVHEHG